MHLVEILLPLYDNEGRRFGAEAFDRVRDELAARFGGVTAFRRSPAEGVWREGGEESRDRVVVFEVMSDALEREWWRDYRADLERRFRQEKMVVRATEFEEL
ncbi:MAG: hypothetical protein M3444_16345 [Acidobacteriota bacterium]|nr:hypothetical protein [Acidobacteriota bacterium]MDQ5835540.1 hypothetical protein [Acidobacteriota bacterium]